MLRHAALVAGIAGLALLANAAGILRPLDDTLTEFRFAQAERPPTGSVVLVDIDSKSLDAVGQWPWPRETHATIIDALHRLGAAQIAVDIDFSTASNEASDLTLEEALKRAGGGVILASFNQDLVASPNADAIHANMPIDRFATNAWPATVNVRPDADGEVRRFSYGERIGDTELPSIPAMLGDYAGAVDGGFLIDFGIDADAIDRIPAADLLQGTVDPKRVAGKKVIFGASAVELRDLLQVPRYGIVSGPMVQALAAESILQHRPLVETGLPVTLAGILAIAFGVAASRRLRWTRTLAWLGASALAIEVAAILIQRTWPLVVDTSAWQASLGAYALVLMLREIGLRRILLAISSNETLNTRTILSQVVSDSFAGVVVVDEDGIIRAASRTAETTLFPGTSVALEGKRWNEALPPALAAPLGAALADIRVERWAATAPQELRYIRPDGEERILDYVVRPSRLSGGVSRDGARLPDSFVASLTFADVTERRRSEAHIAYLARFDTLTGLPNRNQFTEALAAVCAAEPASGEAAAVLFFDLDRFKNVNDTLGHEYGDLVLRAVAERVGCLIAPGDLAARFGGDEYAILHHGAAGKDAAALAEALIARLGEPYHVEGHRLIIGVSVGIAFVQPGAQPPRVMKNADTALYRAKVGGGNAYRVYQASMDAGLEARQRLEVDLWDAFEHDQFRVLYQPQVDLATGEMIGVEALVRWLHPKRGFVSPAEFVPVAEAVGLIEPLGSWVMHQACKAAASWPKPIKVAVNVSPVQFTRGDLVATVRSALAESGLPAARLDLEITESLFVHENAAIHHTMTVLRETGLSFSIDDFGTGYSSLSYIRKFPVQKVKIDKSFIDGLPNDAESTAIVSAIAAMTRSLGIRLNAEGIEQPEQSTLLRLVGCGEGQGYLFGKAVESSEIAARLAGETTALRLSA